MFSIGLKTDSYPREASEQNAKAVGMIKELMQKVLGRDEEFSLSVRRSTQQRFAKDSKLILVPPIEVRFIQYIVLCSRCLKLKYVFVVDKNDADKCSGVSCQRSCLG